MMLDRPFIIYPPPSPPYREVRGSVVFLIQSLEVETIYFMSPIF